MSRVAGFVCLCVLVGCLGRPASAQDKKSPKVDEAALRGKLLAGPTIEAKLTEVNTDDDEKKFALQYVHQVKKARPGGQAKYVEAVRRYNAALGVRSTSLEQLQKMMADVKAAEKDAFDIEETPVTFNLSAGKGLVVRTQELPAGEDGKPKKLSQAEIRKLRGDGRYPGYQAALKDLAAGQRVRVTIDKAKLKPGATKNEDTVYPVTLIVVLPAPDKVSEADFKPIPLK